MLIWHFSDSHGFHDSLIIPSNVDLVIFSGDESNSSSPAINEFEARKFLDWYSKLPIKYKVFVAGNHSTAIAKGLITKKDFDNLGIIYLENESVTIEGLKIYGSPFTPTFGNWAFMKARDKLFTIWEDIPQDTDIIVIHGPPRTILDLSYNRSNELEFCGCRSLYNRVRFINPRFCMFGHIHNTQDVMNAGTRTIVGSRTVYSNGAVMTDAKFDLGPTSHGNLFEI